MSDITKPPTKNLVYFSHLCLVFKFIPKVMFGIKHLNPKFITHLQFFTSYKIFYFKL